ARASRESFAGPGAAGTSAGKSGENRPSPPPPPGVVGGSVSGAGSGFSVNGLQGAQPTTVSPVVTAAQPTRAAAARKEKDLSSSDQAARQKVAAANVDGGTLPSAPEPSSGRQDLRRFTPPLSSTSTQNRADLEVAPPTTSSSPQPPPSADDTKLATSG